VLLHIGIDDTDIVGSAGTNQLARRLARALPDGFALVVALRHQLLVDPRIPYTSQNGSASLLVSAPPGRAPDALLPILRREMRDWYIEGSDPGLCLAAAVPDAVGDFGERCQREPVRQEEARALAREHGIHLEGFGGTEGGVIGALAAVGLLARGEDGRVVHMPGWEWPDDFRGPQPIAAVHARGVREVRALDSGALVTDGVVDVGKHLRPSWRGARAVLFVEPDADGDGEAATSRWRARKLP
jgi:hypothetical protein